MFHTQSLFDLKVILTKPLSIYLIRGLQSSNTKTTRNVFICALYKIYLCITFELDEFQHTDLMNLYNILKNLLLTLEYAKFDTESVSNVPPFRNQYPSFDKDVM